MHTLKRIATVFALAVAVTSIASAVPASGTVLINLGTISTDISDPLSLASTITTVAGSPTVVLSTGDFSGGVVSPGDSATVDPLSFSVASLPVDPGVFTFGPLNMAGTALRFSYTVDSVVSSDLDDSGTGISFLTIITQGTFVDSDGVFDTTTLAGMGIVVGEACVGGTCSIGGIALFNAQAFIPEPATLTLFGSALIAIAGYKLCKSRSRG